MSIFEWLLTTRGKKEDEDKKKKKKKNGKTCAFFEFSNTGLGFAPVFNKICKKAFLTHFGLTFD